MWTRPVDLKSGQVLYAEAGSNNKLGAASEIIRRSGLCAPFWESRCVAQPELDPGSCAGSDIEGWPRIGAGCGISDNVSPTGSVISDGFGTPVGHEFRVDHRSGLELEGRISRWINGHGMTENCGSGWTGTSKVQTSSAVGFR